MVSVIIPNYNHAPYLKQRIDSVLNQTFKDFELIILDDCSTDTSKKVIENYRDHQKVSNIVYNERNSGSTFKQWKKGIELAKGEFIWIAESDDYCDEVFLEMAIGNLKEKSASIAFCQSAEVDENGSKIGDYLRWTEDIKSINWHRPFCMKGRAFINEALQFKNAIPNASAVVFKKKEVDFSKILAYKMKGDWLFWLCFLMSDDVIYYSPSKLNFYRTHPYTTRHQWSNLRMVRSSMEELGVIRFLRRTGFASKSRLKENLHRSIVLSLPYFSEYKRLCKELSLPLYFLANFFATKMRLKLNREFGISLKNN